MRIIGGSAGGRRLYAPKGLHTRPTADRVKEALFNVIAQRLPGAVVLDAFAGSGALGLEALSRGAAEVVFVEAERQAQQALRHNLALCDFAGARVLSGDVRKLLPRLGLQFDLVFLDPPYNVGLLPQMLDLLREQSLLKPQALVVVETTSGACELDPLPVGWQIVKHGRYGDTALYYCQLEEMAKERKE